MSKVKFNAILAVSKDLGIGNLGKLPWHIPGELKYFSNTTRTYLKQETPNIVIMGRKTFESLPAYQTPLKDRINIVLSKSAQIPQSENLIQSDSLESALALIERQFGINQQTFVIGGKSLYEESFTHPNCQAVFVTRVNEKFPVDVSVPKNYLDQFQHAYTSKTYVHKTVPYDFQLFTKPGVYLPFFQPLHEEMQYLQMIKKIMAEGAKKEDRTGTGTLSIFGGKMEYDLSQSFPLMTTKRVFWRGIAEELLWFIRGDTNGKKLKDKGVNIWTGNGSREYLDSIGLNHREEDDLGPVYGFQWRHFGAEYKDMHANYEGQGKTIQLGVDQLKSLIETIKTNPDRQFFKTSRRLIMSAWNPVDLKIMALPPCHVFSQYYVEDGKLSCIMYQRSCDMGLGVPFNIASYALLTCLIAQQCGLKRGKFVHMMGNFGYLGDMHVYSNHVEALKQQVDRVPNPFPVLNIKNKRDNIEDYEFEDFEIVGYNPQGKIKMDMAV